MKSVLGASVVIVSFRTPALTATAARSALHAGVEQVVVVDNASGDKTLHALSAMASPALLALANASNVGFGSAANRGARAGTGGHLIFLNSDAVLSADACQSLTAELSRSGMRAIAGPRLVEPDGTTQRSAGLLPGPFDLTIRALGLHSIGRRFASVPLIGRLVRQSRLAREHASAEFATETIDTNMVSGACFAIGREAFWELGGFDERFFMYFEDADLCRRAAAAGMPIRFVPSAVVEHIGGASSEGDYHFTPMHARSMRQYLGKWYDPGGSALALVLLWLRAVAMTLSLRGGARRAWRALWAAANDEDPRR